MSNIAFEWATLRESVVMALVAIRANKLRSILTLLGIVVGVFSIISVMTAVGVLRNSIEEGLSQLGVNTFQVQKYPNFRVGGRRIRNIGAEASGATPRRCPRRFGTIRRRW